MNASLDRDGFAIVRGAISPGQLHFLTAALGASQGAGRRGLLGTPAVRTLADSETLFAIVAPHMAAPFHPVRAIFFDKNPEANWLVPWHQDVTIAVRERCDAPGFGPWSVKDGIAHVQPPVKLLEQMLAVRIHLDDCDADDNGALRVLPGSHLRGRLSPEQIAAAHAAGDEVLCAAAAGDVLLMRPLLLHASSRSTSPRRRRVLHLEYCAATLPPGLAWHKSA